jgi:hypothetical protein
MTQKKKLDSVPPDVEVARIKARRYNGPIPVAAEHWLPQTRSWFNSLNLSAQAELFEPSDWATAVTAAEFYDIFLRSHNASIGASYVRLSERLGATVSDRRRARIEVEPPEPEDADDKAADNVVRGWQARLAESNERKTNASQ